MESKLCRQRNAMISLAKPKNKIGFPEKQNTWSNLLNKKKSVMVSQIKPNKKSIEKNAETKSKSVQCDSSNLQQCQNYASISVFNPIRTLQFLLKEITELPNDQRTKKIVDEMQVILEKITDEWTQNEHFSKLYTPAVNDNFMIPTRENDHCLDLKLENISQENKYFLMLVGKITKLENNYNQLATNFTKSEEKLQSITSERDKLLEKFKESCDSLEMLNNREHEYLSTITELKSKLMTSERLIGEQQATINHLKQKINNLPFVNQAKKCAKGSVVSDHQNAYNAVLKENNELKKNYDTTKLNLDKQKIVHNFKDNEVAKLKSDINQMKKIVLSSLDNADVKFLSMTSKPDSNFMKDFSESNKDNKNTFNHNIDSQYLEYNQKASAIKLAKTELQQLFETIKTQANLSKKLFNSSVVENDNNFSDLSDEEDNHSNVSNFMSIVTDSSY